jgi:hypothetical protein
MTIAFAAVHRTLRYRDEDTNLYVCAFDNGTTFISTRQPRLFDASARLVTPRELLPGTDVNVCYERRLARNWMDAIQLVKEPPEEEPPFRPVLDDGHL